jgi:hypothetical protein
VYFLSYSNGTFNLTFTKLKKWHLNANHQNIKDCIYCEGNMEGIAKEFEKNGLEVLSVGHAWVKIKAVKNYSPYGGGRTDEIELIYNLIADKNKIDKPKLSTSKQRYAVTMQYKELFGEDLNLGKNTTHDEIVDYFKIINDEKESRSTR